MSAGIFWTVANILVFAVDHLAVVVASKVLKGIGMGLVELIVSMYVSEILAPSIRGSAIAIFHVGHAIGAVAMMGLTFWLISAFHNPMLFRYQYIAEIVPALVFIICGALFPQSPRWLAQHNRWQEAAVSMDKIQLMNQTTTAKNKRVLKVATEDDDDERRRRVIQAYTSGPVIRECSHGKLLGKTFRRQTAMSIFVMIASQLTCIHVLMYFFEVLCGICQVGGGGMKLVSIVHYMATLVFSVFLALSINTCRRKDSLVFGFVLVGASLTALGALLCVYGTSANHDTLLFQMKVVGLPSSAVLALFLLFVSLQAIFITPVSWTYVCELFPGYARTKAISLAMIVYWITDAVLRLLVPLTIKFIKQYLFIAAGVVAILSGLVITQFPETRYLNDVEIEALYDDSKSYDIEVQHRPQSSHQKEPEPEPEMKPSPGTSNEKLVYYHQENQNLNENTLVNHDKLSIFTSNAPSSSCLSRPISPFGVTHSPDEATIAESQLSRVFPQPTTADDSYFSQDWAHNLKASEDDDDEERAFKEVDTTNESLMLPVSSTIIDSHPQSSTLDSVFHHRNHEGSPLKAGFTYEPTTFLQHDVLHLSQKDQYDTWKQNGKLQLMSKYTL
ncbi:uncharacterized protein KQ657_003097 [Scheffersomyces spartinae]|uniref:Major facilitator superfamily (MFS) profile domain-containing protein n=1 Tax=Scheffersomyces spartinae TaxID=45513 RepID=A0A9P8AGW4_9ASCO|nr:uncharacterized protein KQ657_003097 [Scheffersomyces spartinae]KAG7191502.1 hypothetical protein KQ657_003097 [Scheffersomyces spartinae]